MDLYCITWRCLSIISCMTEIALENVRNSVMFSYSVRGPDNRLSASLGDRQGLFQGAVVALSLSPPSASHECPRAFSSPL